MNLANWQLNPPLLVRGLAVFTIGFIAFDAGATCATAAAPFVGALLSAAGLGVAGGTLHGAAASSAGLAWLGGGSLAAGGGGVAAGTMLVTQIGGASGAALGIGATAVIGETLNKKADAQASES